ncbi:MAG TPA: TonB family protein [Thermoanaerobaculia bacterium]|nr:TonB family protein [Thermoanaerobaculia bacterium]
MALLDEHIEGKYEILEKLREGGMGAIYKVRHRLLDEIRVVKVIRSAVAGHPGAGERFLREARSAIRLRHPNIAALHDFAIADDDNAYIVMEFIDGSNLQEILDRHGRPPLALTLEIARQSLRALGYLHRQKIVHRDVAPDNLMLTRDVDGRALVKLIDLGIAKAFEEAAAGLTSTGTFLGKPRYASPEQFSGTGLDARSDLYSFGVVLYELLTGRSPILGSDPASYLAGHLLRPPLDFAESDPEGRVPPALREIVLRSLAKQPEERFADAEEFAWALTLIQDELEPAGSGEMAALLRPRPVEEEVVPFPVRPGSTQSRLDREFLMTQEPLPVLPPAATVLADAATVALPRPASAPPVSGLSVLDDLTWVTAPVRKVEDVPLPSPPPARVAGAQSARSPRWRIALSVAAAVLVLAAGGGFWWMRAQRTRPVELPPAVVVSPTVAPVSMPAEPAPAPMNKDAAPTTEEFQAATQPPSPPPAAAKPAPERPKRVDPEEATVAPADVTPMQPGALIRPGMPNVEVPVPLDIPRVAYPEAARGSGRKVSVRMKLLVDENGRVLDVKVAESDGSVLGFDEAAVAAARQVVFQPATRDGIPGKMWTDLILEFAE